MTKVKFAAGVLLAATLAVPTGTAFAVDAYGGGAHAWTPAAGDSGRIAIKDNSDDGDDAKAEYYRYNSPTTKRTLWNHSGYGTTVYSGDGSKVIRFQACDDNDWAPDDCSGWKTA
ncbi:hypothetical protein ACGFS9_22830 [Streptomyces sp. NPDC048566]|uniref:hypothetical protein n=1 Tax=Streptomyces sp. NPDC048566 TaxID=3365569 RepID=UPI0037113599